MNQPAKTMMWPEVLPRAGNRRLENLESLSPWFEIYRVCDACSPCWSRATRKRRSPKSIDYLVDLLPRVNHLCPSHNEAYVEKTALIRVQQAFEQIVADAAPFETEGNARVYRFDGFGLMVPV